VLIVLVSLVPRWLLRRSRIVGKLVDGPTRDGGR
jgi:hypothetical protein